MNCFIFFDTCASRNYVSLPSETSEAGPRNFASDGEQNIVGHKFIAKKSLLLEILADLCETELCFVSRQNKRGR